MSFGGCEMAVRKGEVVGRMRVEYFYDPQSKNWGFVVPSLHIVGGSDTREEAEQEALDAVVFALEYYGERETPADVGIADQESYGTEITYVPVTLQPSEAARVTSTHRTAGRRAEG
jgi:hypothetical protein